MRILLLTLPCCLFLGCDSTSEDTTSPKTPPVQEVLQEKPATKKPSLLDRLEEDEVSIDHEAKYTYTPPEDPNWISFGSLRAPKPTGWSWVPPKTLDVTCNYTIPSFKHKDRGLFTVLQYKIGECVTLADHIARWKLLFRSNEGGPIIPIVSKFTFGEVEATQVEFRGEYMGAGGAWHLPHYALLVVSMKSDDGTTHFKLTGPESTLKANLTALHTLLSEVEVESAPTAPKQ
jgi:hypothetical protein